MQANAPEGPNRQLSLSDSVAIYVGMILGSGAFFAPADVAAATTNVWGSLLLWTLGGLVTICGAWVYAECGARLPQQGGFYVFYRETLGHGIAFVGGWVGMLITYPASIAVMSMVCARYLGVLISPLASHESLTAAAVAGAAGALNLLGVKQNAFAQRVLTGVKVLAVAGVCGAALLVRPEATAVIAPAQPLELSSLWLMASVGIMWTYSGWADVTLISGELRDPAKNLGRCVWIGTAIVVLLYAWVQFAVESVLTPEVADTSTAVVADTVRVAFGASASGIVAAAVVISTFGAIHGTTLVVSRLGYAMGQDGVAPRALSRLHPRLETPVWSIAAVMAAIATHIAFNEFRQLLGLFTFSVWIFYGITAIALIRLRARKVGEPLTYEAPRGHWVPGVMLVTAAVMTVSLLLDPEQQSRALGGLGLMAAGGVVYVIWRRLAPARTAA